VTLFHHLATAHGNARNCGAGRLHAISIAIATLALITVDRWSAC